MRGSIQAWPTRPNKAASENPLRPARTETNRAGMEGIRTDPWKQGPVGPEQVLRRVELGFDTSQNRLAQPIGERLRNLPTMEP